MGRCGRPNGISVTAYLVEPEAEFDGHLEVGHLTVLDVSPDIHYLEPVEVAHGLVGAVDRAANGIVDRFGRRPDDLADTVGVIAHSNTPSYVGPSIVGAVRCHKTHDGQGQQRSKRLQDLSPVIKMPSAA